MVATYVYNRKKSRNPGNYRGAGSQSFIISQSYSEQARRFTKF